MDEIEALLAGDVAAAGEGLYPPGPPITPYNPNQWSEFAEGGDAGIEMMSPEQQAAPGVPLLQPQSQSASVRGSASQSRSHSGFPGGPMAVDAQFAGAHEQADQVFANELNPQFVAEGQLADQHYGDLNRAMAEQALVTEDFHKRQYEMFDRQQDIVETHAELTKQIYAESVLQREQFLGDYKEKLVAVRQLAAMSGNPLGGLSSGEALGLAGAAFAQGMLAVQGVKIDPIGQTSQWVDRSIQEHQMKVGNARDVANDSMHLYDIAKQSAKDDFEARQLYHGMVLEGLKVGVQMNAERFNSDIARARGAEKIAMYQLEQDKLFADIGKRRQDAYFGIHKQMADEAKDAGTLKLQRDAQSLGWYNAQTGRMEANARKKAAEAKTEKPDLRIADAGATVRDPKTNKIIGYTETHRVKPGLSDGIASKAYEKAANLTEGYTTALSALADLSKLRAPVFDSGISALLPGVREMDPEYREYKRAKVLYTERLIKALTGAAAPTDQMNRISSLLADDSLFQKGGNQSALVQLERDLRGSMKGRLDSDPALEPIPAGEQSVRPVHDTPNDTDAAYRAEVEAKGAVQGPVGTAAAGAVKAGRNEVKLGGGYSPSFFEFMSKTGDRRGSGKTGNREASPGQRQEIDAVDQLAALWARPDTAPTDTVGGKSQADPDLRAKAYAALAGIAGGTAGAGGRAPDEETQAYAQSVLKTIDDGWSAASPEALYDQFARRMHLDADDPALPQERKPVSPRLRPDRL
jgi:hypothetical protein